MSNPDSKEDRKDKRGARPLRHVHAERPISRFYLVIDNDLARDNLENDLPMADLQDL